MATYEQAIQALRAADAAGNVDDAKRLAQMASRLKPQQPAKTQEQPVKPEGFSLTETVKNIPGSAVELGKSLIQPILHPVDTAKSLQTVGQGLVEKAIPDTINGVDFGQTENEQSVDTVGEYIKGRYGSVENLTKTVQDDPVGVAFDISGLLTGGGALAAKTGGKVANIAGKVEKAGKAVDPVNLIMNTVQSAGKLVPENLPASLLETAMKFRPSIKPDKRAAMTKTALDQGILPTVGGLRKITDKLSELDAGINKIIDTATERGVTISKKVLFGQLRKLKAKLGGAKLDAGDDIKNIEAVAKALDEQLTKLKKDNLTPREVQDLKTDAYKRINFDMSQGQGNFAKNETRKTVARSAKESLEQLDPNIKPMNQQMGSLIELQDELERVVSRLDNRNVLSLDTAVKVGAGSAIDPKLGTVVGTAASALGAPRVKARIALTLHNIRKNAETASYIQNNLNPVLARQLLIQSGRLDGALKKQLEQEKQN